MRVFLRSLPIVMLIAGACAKETTPAPEVVSTAEAAPLNPWEPIDPGFIGCEGG